MEVVILPDADAVARFVADSIEHLLSARPNPVLGLATGSSPLGTYAELVRRHRAGVITFAAATAFLLDEYIGLPVGHPESYRAFIETHFAGQVDIDPRNVHVPGGTAVGAALDKACAQYEADIRAAGGVDLQLLGIGADGHLGFNEPTSSLASRTRIKTLTDRTRHDNARFFDGLDDVPRHVVTQGIGTILDARHLVLIATGASKAAPVALAVEGPLTSMCPASAIQLHPTATVVIDEAAASQLTLADYFRDTFAHKPRWQS
ncbi:MAG: glucosamine-6-phosphate deaminase [Solirubrobacterales bacterium]|nr:glucosamine-6-phosphate deaminase [Solirubrobacterales bacterium]